MVTGQPGERLVRAITQLNKRRKQKKRGAEEKRSDDTEKFGKYSHKVRSMHKAICSNMK